MGSQQDKELFEEILKNRVFNQLSLMNGAYVAQNRQPVPPDETLENRAKIIFENLGIKEPKKEDSLDVYYGQFINFAWHQIPAEGGASFAPIMYETERLKKCFVIDSEKLDSIRRRSAYLSCLKDEIGYIQKRYKLEQIKHSEDWITLKLEEFIRLAAELSLLIVEYYIEKKGKNTGRIRFESLLDNLEDQYFKYLNPTVDGFVITKLRHIIVHSTRSVVEKKDNEFFVFFEKEKLEKIGLMEKYVEDVFKLFNQNKQIPNSQITIQDPRFPGVILYYRLGKQGQPVFPDTTISFSAPLNQFLKDYEGFVFILARKLLSKIT